MRGFVAALGAVLVCGFTARAGLPQAEAKEAEEFTVGQWGGYVYTNDTTGQFTDCTIWAYNNADVQVGISVNSNYNLDLYLNSKTWDLPANESYPISYWVDRNPVYHGKAATYSQKFVKIEVEKGQAVFDELKSGSQVTFRTQSDDYVFGLTGSSAAMNRLLDCVDRYVKGGTTTNPFGGGGSSTQNGGGQGSQASTEPQGGGGGTGGSEQNGGGTSMKLKSLTQSTDQVRQFLVDVTGAKPSMISIDAKENKSGYPYYSFSTPIGAGQFWQEYLGNDALRDVVAGYFNGYKEECKGEFAQDVRDTVKGDRGQAVLGVATCSNSPYQDNGAEVLSYALTASGDVISVYVTFVGGNAAKAKTDSLGKLISRRQESDIQ